MSQITNYHEQGIIEKFEPKRKNLYIMTIDGIPAWQIKSTARPTCTINKVTVDYLNIKRHFSTGKLQWSDIPITVMDVINPSAGQQVMAWLKLHHDASTGRAGYASLYKRDITIDILGPGLEVIQKWNLQGCHITGSIDFGDLDFSAQQIQDINFTLSVDKAILQY